MQQIAKYTVHCKASETIQNLNSLKQKEIDRYN